MHTSRILTALALATSVGCAHGDGASATNTTDSPRTTSEIAAAPAPSYTVHEWGLFAIDVNAPTTTSVASGVAHSAPTPAIGHGAGTGYAYKPVIYVHLDEGLNEQRFDVIVGIPPSSFVERWPGGTDLQNDVIPVFGGWRGVLARRGACANPTPAPTECASTPDGFCESTEIPRYYGDRDTCLTADGSEADLLFYRTASVPAAGLPLRVSASGDELAVERVGAAAVEGPVLYITSDGTTTHIFALDGASLGGPIATTGLTEITPDAARALLATEAMRRGLSTMEAEAFVDAWSPAYFAHCTRTGPEASGTTPAALQQARISLLHFAPRQAVDAMLPLRTDPPARETSRAFLVRWIDASRPLVVAPAEPLPDGARPRVRLAGAPRPNGTGLAPDMIRRVIQRNINQLVHCYEQELTRDTSVAGRMTVHATITPAGAVGDATAEDGHVGSDGLATCYTRAFRRWTFPQPSTGAETSFDVTFTLSIDG